MVEPLIEASAALQLRPHLDVKGEFDADLIDLSVRESVVQLHPRGKVEIEE